MSYRTVNLQMLHFIYYSTNIRTEYFKHAAHSVFSSSKCRLRGLLEKYPTFGREKETGLLGALDT